MNKNIIRMKQKAYFDKNKNIVLESVKLYANKKAVNDKVILTKAMLLDLSKSKDVRDFRNKFIRKYDIVKKLNLDSQAYKKALCSHVRYFSHANKVAELLKKENFALVYEAKKDKKAKTKAVKTTAKKSVKAVKTVKKQLVKA